MSSRGSNAKDSWEQLRKSCGIAPLDDIKKFLRRDDTEVLTRSELISRVENYFSSCIRTVTDDEGRTETLWCSPPTKTGLARAIGCEAQTLLDYCAGTDSKGNPYSTNPDKKRLVANEDFDVIRKSYQICEEFFESQLPQNKNNSGSIFWLLNSRNRLWSNEQSLKVRPEFLNDKKEKPIVSTDFALKMLLESREEEEREEKEEDDEENNDISAGT